MSDDASIVETNYYLVTNLLLIMELGRGFKYFLQTSTRFPTTNLDLYIPRKLSTTEVNEIVVLGDLDDSRNLKTEAFSEEIPIQSDHDSDEECSTQG